MWIQSDGRAEKETLPPLRSFLLLFHFYLLCTSLLPSCVGKSTPLVSVVFLSCLAGAASLRSTRVE